MYTVLILFLKPTWPLAKTFILPCFTLISPPNPGLPRLSMLALTLPLYPALRFFFNTIFKMPEPPPDASNFADGLVIISTVEMASAGICSNVMVVGLPSTNICGAALRRVTLPSISTLTLGTFFITSTAVPPVLVIFFSTLKILRSILIVSKALLEVTVTSCNCWASVSILILPRSLSMPLSKLL